MSADAVSSLDLLKTAVVEDLGSEACDLVAVSPAARTTSTGASR